MPDLLPRLTCIHTHVYIDLLPRLLSNETRTGTRPCLSSCETLIISESSLEHPPCWWQVKLSVVDRERVTTLEKREAELRDASVAASAALAADDYDEAV